MPPSAAKATRVPSPEKAAETPAGWIVVLSPVARSTMTTGPIGFMSSVTAPTTLVPSGDTSKPFSFPTGVVTCPEPLELTV